jgi:hypothetical protein
VPSGFNGTLSGFENQFHTPRPSPVLPTPLAASAAWNTPFTNTDELKPPCICGFPNEFQCLFGTGGITMTKPTRDQVFISYSHRDRAWLEDLQGVTGIVSSRKFGC